MTRAALAALLLAAAPALAQREMLDAAGRFVVVPDRVERVYAAGPPASLLVYAINPDKLLGWTRALRADEAPFFPDKYAQLPELGRLTGRGNTANIIGLYWAGKILYPELFPEDLRAKTAEFYKLFYHRAPSAAQLDALLGEPGVLPR